MSECQGISTSGIATVQPVSQRTGSGNNMLFMAMAFKSVRDIIHAYIHTYMCVSVVCVVLGCFLDFSYEGNLEIC